jgi:hypothetical protein
MTHPFTPEYISMAKAAEEIQAMRPIEEEYPEGDWYSTGSSIYLSHDDRDYGPDIRKEGEAWLPRLDQLLGMLGNPFDFARYLRGLSYEEVNIEETGECRDWHELALSGVMREKYGKVWTGTEWRKA